MDEQKEQKATLPKPETALMVGSILVGFVETEHGKCIGLKLGSSPVFALPPMYADILCTQVDMLLGQLEEDLGGEDDPVPPEPEGTGRVH